MPEGRNKILQCQALGKCLTQINVSHRKTELTYVCLEVFYPLISAIFSPFLLGDTDARLGVHIRPLTGESESDASP